MINQSVKEIVLPGAKSSTVAFAIRLGAVLIKRSIAPAVATCPNERKPASAYLFFLSLPCSFSFSFLMISL